MEEILNQLRLVVFPIIYMGLGYIQPVVVNGISEPSTAMQGRQKPLSRVEMEMYL